MFLTVVFEADAHDLIAVHEQEREECEDQGATPEQPSEAPPECTSDDDHVGKGLAEGFGPLKTVLEVTSAVYSNYKVRSRLPV